MRFAVLLTCAAVFLHCYALGRPDLTHDAIMGVSQKKLRDYIIKAIEGFRKMMPYGDEQLDYPVMDPYDVEDASWDYVDKSNSKKYRLNFQNKNTPSVKGLSNFDVTNVRADAKDMSLSFKITFKNLQTEFPYYLEGHMLKNFLPVWGEGIVRLSAPEQSLYCAINLGIDQSYIVVEDVLVSRYSDNIDVQASGLMDLPEPFANLVLDDILDHIMTKYGGKALNDFTRELVEDAVGGMTTEEFFDYLDHFAKKK